jgi:Xaa-Pro dipeptidase
MTIAQEPQVSSATPLLNSHRARTLALDSGFDGIVTATLENNFYLSGVWNFGFELFPYNAEAYVVANADNVGAGTVITSVAEADITLAANPTVKGILTYGAFSRVAPNGASLDASEERLKAMTLDTKPAATAIDALAGALEQQGLIGGSIGVDERGANRGLIDALTARLPGTRFTAAADLLRRIRMVKTPGEHRRLIQTLRITEAAFEATVAAAYPGVTERELKRVFDTAVVAAGASPAFAFIRFGRGMALGQVEPGDTKLVPGDYIWFDIGCTYQGYRSDIGRIVSFGEPSKRLCDLYEASIRGQDRAFEMMQPGNEARAVFAAAVERIRESGIPHYERHHVGHGIGVEFYDSPLLAPSADTQLEEGMVFEVETPYYELGFGGTFIEDTVIIRSDGPEIVTRLSRDLRVIEL